MLSRMYLLAGALCVSSYALAVTPSIGSVTARGETRIDSREVQGSGTVFDGSVIETGQSISSGADLRLANNAEITLSRDSRGTLHHDYFVLQQGTAQLGLTNSFRVQANGLMIVPAEANSSGLVSIDQTNSVSVEANNGTLEIRNSSGASVARVRPGHPLSFSSVADKSPAEFSATGTVTSENGRYYLNSTETGLNYEVKGDGLQDYVGTSVVASGVLEAAASASAGIGGVLVASSIQSSNASATALTGQPAQAGALIRGWSIGEPKSIMSSTTTRVCPPDPLVDCCPGLPLPKCCNPLPSSQCGHSH